LARWASRTWNSAWLRRSSSRNLPLLPLGRKQLLAHRLGGEELLVAFLLARRKFQPCPRFLQECCGPFHRRFLGLQPLFEIQRVHSAQQLPGVYQIADLGGQTLQASGLGGADPVGEPGFHGGDAKQGGVQWSQGHGGFTYGHRGQGARAQSHIAQEQGQGGE